MFKINKFGFARAIVLYLQNLEILTPRIDAQKGMFDTLYNIKEMVFKSLLQSLANLFGQQILLTLIEQAYSHQPLKLH